MAEPNRPNNRVIDVEVCGRGDPPPQKTPRDLPGASRETPGAHRDAPGWLGWFDVAGWAWCVGAGCLWLGGVLVRSCA